MSPKTYNRAEAPTSHGCHGNYRQRGPRERWEGPAQPPAGAAGLMLRATCQGHAEAEGHRWFGPTGHMGFREVWKEVRRQKAVFCFCAFPTASARSRGPRPTTGFHGRPSSCWGPGTCSPGLPKGPKGSSRLAGGLGESPSRKHKLQSGFFVRLTGGLW